jgi:hypothetical protein
MTGKRKTNSKEPNGATLGFKQKLWAAADARKMGTMVEALY